MASNLGGTATLVGDPPNIIIGSMVGLTFNQFIAYLLIPVLVATIAVIAYFRAANRVSFKPIDDDLTKLFSVQLLIEKIEFDFMAVKIDRVFMLKSLACLAPSVLWRRNEVVVTVPRHEDVGVGEVLVRSLRERASAVIRRRVEALAEASGFRPRRVSVRDQKTRWGSCSGRGTLTFNWRLIFAPPSVLDYVVVHELCHLRHAHHGPRFWAAVEALCPNYQAHRDWLRDNGARLRVESA
jgi:predicted metal-dependent hydrolase